MTVQSSSIDAARPASGAAMDRALPAPSRWRRWRWVGLGSAALLLGALALWWHWPQGVAVPAEGLQIHVLRAAPFEDLLLVRAQATPAQALMLDATEPGRVEAVLAHEGQRVHAGDWLYRLSNPQRDQELMQRSAELAQQTANAAQLHTALAQAQSQWRRELAQAEHEAAQASLNVERQQALAAQGFVSPSVLADAQARAQLQQRLLVQLRQDGAAEMLTRQRSAAQMTQAVHELQRNLQFLRQQAQQLQVRAPRDGVLSDFKLQVGASVRVGERLGRIVNPQDLVLRAGVDEFYLPRVQLGQSARVTDGPWQQQRLRVSRITSQVSEGRFEIELAPEPGAGAVALQPGQALHAQLQLADSAGAAVLQLPDGRYLSEAEGAVFVLDADGRHARRRTVRLGRRSAGQVEVLAGLQAGERVITSSLGASAQATVLRLP
ncbi:efflux RND transporter periplasmic adaptor subunit [Roseateles sp. BYS180W]|uniref:Efflux RND transporter periplasmic adaptor subunit n=1 Tax=Roseateles rivi TaxID=3299028 RepID=A0ABW7FU96_9BURK